MLKRKNGVLNEPVEFETETPEIEDSQELPFENEPIFEDINVEAQEQQEEEEEIPEDVLEGASEVISMLFITAAQLTPYWNEKRIELEAKYGSVDAFNDKLKNNVLIAIKGNKWLQKLLTKAEFVGNIISLTPLLMTLYELYKPPSIQQPKQEEIEISNQVVNEQKNENKPSENRVTLTPGVYPLD